MIVEMVMETVVVAAAAAVSKTLVDDPNGL